MWARIKGEIRGADGWMLDPCEVSEDGVLPECPDCGRQSLKYNAEVVQHTCECGSVFDVWTVEGRQQRRLVMVRATYCRSGHYLDVHHPGRLSVEL